MSAARELSPAHDLHREIEACRYLLATYRDIVGDDEQARADMVEGETNLLEAIERGIARLIELKTMREALAEAMAAMRARDARFESQEEHYRTAIQTALGIAERKSLETALATVTRAATPAKVVITDESAIPSEFYKRGDPKLSKTMLRDAMVKEKRTIEGAEMSNGGETLHVHLR